MKISYSEEREKVPDAQNAFMCDICNVKRCPYDEIISDEITPQ